MLRSTALLAVFLLAVSARPQDLETNRISVDVNENEIKFETIEAKPAPEITSNDASYGNAVDFSAPATSSIMACIKKAKYQTVFVRAFTPAGSGAFDINAVNNIRLAYTAGLGIEVYMTPQPVSSLQGWQQLDALVQGLNQNGITVRSVWIQVTSPANWPSNPTSNVNFINSIASRARQSGLTVGIYTNQYDWSQITNNWSTIGSDVLLWYWHVLGAGVSGETPATFADFRAFGGFKAASVKQYAQSEVVCQMTVNRDVYAVGIPSALSQLRTTADKRIIVGSIGL